MWLKVQIRIHKLFGSTMPKKRARKSPKARRYFSVSANQREWRCIGLGDVLEVGDSLRSTTTVNLFWRRILSILHLYICVISLVFPKTLHKDSVKTVERFQKCCQWQPLAAPSTVLTENTFSFKSSTAVKQLTALWFEGRILIRQSQRYIIHAFDVDSLIGVFHVRAKIIKELKRHMIPYKFKCSHW